MAQLRVKGDAVKEITQGVHAGSAAGRGVTRILLGSAGVVQRGVGASARA